MSETIIVALIGLVGIVLSGAVGAYIAIRMLKPQVRVLESQEQHNISSALKEVAVAFGEVIDTNLELQRRVDVLEEGREQRTKDIAELRLQIDVLSREHAAEMRDMKQRYDELRSEYKNVLQLLEKGGIDYEPPNDLLDTGKFKGLNK